MTIAGTPERVVLVLYSLPTMRPVRASIEGSSRYRCPAFQATHFSLASFESLLYYIYSIAAGLKHSKA